MLENPRIFWYSREIEVTIRNCGQSAGKARINNFIKQEKQSPRLRLKDFSPKGLINYMDRTWNETGKNVLPYNLGLMAISYTYAISAGLAAVGLEKLIN